MVRLGMVLCLICNLLPLPNSSRCMAQSTLQNANALTSSAENLIEGEVVEIGNGYGFTEGPLWLPEKDCFIFSDIPEDTIFREDGTVFMKPSGKSNGLTLDSEGRLVVCQHWHRRVIRINHDGTEQVLADSYQGKKLNSPNDLVIRSDGVIYFSDPPFGLMYFGPKREAEMSVNGVYRIDLDGSLTRVIDDMQLPNGLAFSPDEKTLYISDDIDDGFIRACDVLADGTLSRPRMFAEGLVPDGMKVDVEGNVWCTSRYEVEVFHPSGRHLGSITFPQKTANLAFGGSDSKTLTVTARKGVYQVRTKIAGIHPKPNSDRSSADSEK
jgi:gluconolactonase